MRNIVEIYDFIDKIAPFNTAMDFDNVGILVKCKDQIKSILVSLDITSDTIEEAKQLDAQLIISHHPVIFNPLRKICYDDISFQLVQNGISAICAHTNLDMAREGVNDCLALKLGLENIRPLEFYNNIPCALIGDFPDETEPDRFALFVKKMLNCKGIRLVRGSVPIKTVGLCSGAGGEFLFSAIRLGASAFVTGEVKHHEILAAKQFGITLIEAGHFYTENIIVEPLATNLTKRFPDLQVHLSNTISDNVEYL